MTAARRAELGRDAPDVLACLEDVAPTVAEVAAAPGISESTAAEVLGRLTLRHDVESGPDPERPAKRRVMLGATAARRMNLEIDRGGTRRRRASRPRYDPGERAEERGR